MPIISSVIRKRRFDELAIFMDPVEFSQLTAIVKATEPKSCLEWGSGGSTRVLLELCPFVERYVSIEHDPEWYKAVSVAIDDPRLELHLVESDEPYPPAGAPHGEIEAWGHKAESDASMMHSYITFPSTLGIRFDFILVDGRSRSQCLQLGYELLKDGGVIVLHDAQREDYQAAIAQYKGATMLEPWKQGQICLIKKTIH